MNYKIAQFILTPPQRSRSTLEIYVAQPDANKEALAGKLFALIEIDSNKVAGLKIINFLINSLNYDYYQNEKMILRERVSTIKIEHIFESALAKTNKKLAEFLQAEKIKLDPEALNITIGVVYDDSLHFANLGKNKALLIYKGQPGETAKYKLADITEQTGAAENKKRAQPIKLFSNIISGSLPRGGYFIFASETFGEYLSAKQIMSIVTTLPPAGAAEQIKNTLSQINAYVPFLGIIIKNTTGLAAEEIKIKEPVTSTKASIANLIVTEEETEKLLTPSGLVNAKKWSSLFNNLIGRFSRNQPKPTNRPALLLKDKIFIKRKAEWLSFNRIFKALKKIGTYLIGLLIYIFKIITDKKALADFFSNLIAKAKNFWLSFRTAILRMFFWYKNLNRINKILFSVFLVCLLIFSLNLGWQNIKKSNTERQVAIANLITTIEQKQNQIDASLLYNNEVGAKKLLEEAKELLAKLPQDNQEQKDQSQRLTAKYQVQIEKISHVIRVTPVELANLTNLNSTAAPTNIIISKNEIYAADAASQTVYNVDIANELTTAINLNDATINKLAFPNLDKNGNIYYLGLNQAFVLDIKLKKISDLKVNHFSDLEKIIDFKQYNNRFYLLDSAQGQIYRLSKSGDQLVNPTPWLNAGEDLTKAAGIDIDGDIYILKNNGEIAKYSKGAKQDFTVAAIEPPLNQAAKIIVSPEGDYLYVLDPAGKRLIVFDKTGRFISQYVSDQFNDLKDFQIDETHKKIYFLNSSKVYSIDMSHASE